MSKETRGFDSRRFHQSDIKREVFWICYGGVLDSTFL